MIFQYLIQYLLGDGTFCAEVCDVCEVACKIGSGIFKNIRVFRLLPDSAPQKMRIEHDTKYKQVLLFDTWGNYVESSHYEEV